MNYNTDRFLVNDLIKLHKLKLLLKANIVAPIYSTFNEAEALVNKLMPHPVNPLGKILPIFAEKKSTSFLVYYFLAQYKLAYLKASANFYKFSSSKYRTLDYRYKNPKLTEFVYTLDPEYRLSKGFLKAKLPLNYSVASFYANSHTFRLVFKKCKYKRLKHWKKYYGFMLKKLVAKQYSFFSFVSSFERAFHSYLFTLLNWPLFFYNGGLPALQPFGDWSIFGVQNAFFYPQCKLRNLLQYNGLFVNFKSLEPLSDQSVYEEYTKKFLTPYIITDYGFFYPFSKKETKVLGVSKPLNEYQYGRMTYYAFLARVMFKKKYTRPVFYHTSLSDRAFPGSSMLIESMYKQATKFLFANNPYYYEQDIFEFLKNNKKCT